MTYSSEVLADTPVGYWHLDETSGTTATDSSGNARNGTYSVNASGLTTTGAVSTAVNLTRASSHQVTIADNTQFRGMTALTLECFVKPSGDIAAGEFWTMIMKGPTPGHVTFNMDYTRTGDVRSIEVAVDDGTNTKNAQFPQVLPTGDWTHIAATWDGTNIRLYINGVAHASSPITDSPVGTTLNNVETNQVRIGSYAGVDFWSGGIDEVAIYRTALSASRIAAHYAAAALNPPIMFVAAGVQATPAAGPTTLSPALPAGVVAGDLMIVFTYTKGTSTTNITGASAGWTQIYKLAGAVGGTMAAYYRYYQAGDAAPTITYSGLTTGTSGQTTFAQVAAWRNVDQTTPIDNTPSLTTNAAAVNIGPITGLTPGINKAGVIVPAGKLDDCTSIALLSGDSMIWDRVGMNTSITGSDATQVWDYTIQPGTAAAISNKTYTVTGGGSVAGEGLMLVLRPIVPASSVDKTGSDSATVTDGTPLLSMNQDKVDSYTMSGETASVQRLSSVTDSGTLTEPTPTASATVATAEILTLSEAAASQSTLPASDSGTLSEAAVAGVQQSVAGSDSGAVTEGSSSTSAAVSGTDSGTLSEAAASNATAAATDNGTMSDAVTAMSGLITVADSLALGDLAAISSAVAASDSLALADVVTSLADVTLKVGTDSGSLTDTSALLQTLAVAASETHSVSESLSISAALGASDALVLAEAVVAAATLVASDSLTQTEASGVEAVLALAASDSASASEQSQLAQEVLLSVSDGLSMLEALDLAAAASVSDAGLLSSALVVAADLHATDDTAMAETLLLAAAVFAADNLGSGELASLNTQQTVEILMAVLTAAARIVGMATSQSMIQSADSAAERTSAIDSAAERTTGALSMEPIE